MESVPFLRKGLFAAVQNSAFSAVKTVKTSAFSVLSEIFKETE